MKLFAKRTKRVTSTTPSEKRTVFKSDPVCEELLQKDPSTWNAKQRRMIKRYQDRKKEATTEELGEKELEEDQDTKEIEERVDDDKSEEGNSSASDGSEPEEKDGDGRDHHEQNKDKEGLKAMAKPVKSSDDDDDDGSGSDDSDSSRDIKGDDHDHDKNDENNKQGEKERQGAVEEGKNEPAGKIDSPVKSSEKDCPTAAPVNPGTTSNAVQSPETTDLDIILERLDSKNRRKLRRKLDRGEASAAEIRKEAMSILEPSKTAEDESGTKRSAENLAAAETTSKKGNKRRKVDWSALPPEERMRREEQRRVQQEVAARRAAGEMPSTGHRHPLNSERRRANRRKPKWQKPKERPVGNEHDTSGFHMRRSQAAGL